jgi:hypothetical protein
MNPSDYRYKKRHKVDGDKEEEVSTSMLALSSQLSASSFQLTSS